MREENVFARSGQHVVFQACQDFLLTQRERFGNGIAEKQRLRRNHAPVHEFLARADQDFFCQRRGIEPFARQQNRLVRRRHRRVVDEAQRRGIGNALVDGTVRAFAKIDGMRLVHGDAVAVVLEVLEQVVFRQNDARVLVALVMHGIRVGEQIVRQFRRFRVHESADVFISLQVARVRFGIEVEIVFLVEIRDEKRHEPLAVLPRFLLPFQQGIVVARMVGQQKINDVGRFRRRVFLLGGNGLRRRDVGQGTRRARVHQINGGAQQGQGAESQKAAFVRPQQEKHENACRDARQHIAVFRQKRGESRAEIGQVVQQRFAEIDGKQHAQNIRRRQSGQHA